MGLRFPRRLLAVPLAAAALSGCGGAGGAASGGPDPADVMPKSSALYVEAVVRPAGDQQRQVTQLLSKVMRTSDPGAKIRRIIDRKLADEQPGVTYEQDIEPWLGDRVGLTATRLATRRRVLLGAVRVTDAAAAKAFVAREERRERADRRRYGGTEYFVEPDGTATGVVEDFVVVAGTPAAFRGAVDTAKGDGLSDAGRFSDAV